MRFVIRIGHDDATSMTVVVLLNDTLARPSLNQQFGVFMYVKEDMIKSMWKCTYASTLLIRGLQLDVTSMHCSGQ